MIKNIILKMQKYCDIFGLIFVSLSFIFFLLNLILPHSLSGLSKLFINKDVSIGGRKL